MKRAAAPARGDRRGARTADGRPGLDDGGQDEFKPEEEFELHAWVPIEIGPLDLSITKAVAYLWLGPILTILLGIVLMRLRLRVDPTTRQTFGEQIYDIAQTQIAEQGLPSKPCIAGSPTSPRCSSSSGS